MSSNIWRGAVSACSNYSISGEFAQLRLRRPMPDLHRRIRNRRALQPRPSGSESRAKRPAHHRRRCGIRRSRRKGLPTRAGRGENPDRRLRPAKGQVELRRVHTGDFRFDAAHRSGRALTDGWGFARWERPGSGRWASTGCSRYERMSSRNRSPKAMAVMPDAVARAQTPCISPSYTAFEQGHGKPSWPREADRTHSCLRLRQFTADRMHGDAVSALVKSGEQRFNAEISDSDATGQRPGAVFPTAPVTGAHAAEWRRRHQAFFRRKAPSGASKSKR